MNDMPALFAYWDLTDLQGAIFWVIRAVAALVGAIIGWFVSAPCARLLYRMVLRRPIPGGLLPVARLGGAGLLGFLCFLIPLGGGGGGFGLGGGGFGLGSGSGTSKGNTDNGDPVVNNKKPAKGQKKTREKLEIEIIASVRYPGESKWYLLQRKEPPRNLSEIEDYVKDKKDQLEVHIITPGESPGRGTGVLARLQELLNHYGIPRVDPETKD